MLVKLVIALPVLFYLGVLAFLRIREPSMLFHPEARVVSSPEARLGLRERTVSYASSDGTRLSAWIVPAAHSDSSGMWLLICHGNLGNIGYGERPRFYAAMRDLGINLLAFDYRGFGASEGVPDERGFYDDAVASYRFLRDSLRVPADRIILFGHSLGTGVAVETATRVPSAALVVEAAYTSIADRGQELYPYIPVRYIIRNHFASIDKIARVQVPMLFLNSKSDVLIPYAHGKRLFAAASGRKRFVTVRGAHDDAFSVDSSTYFGAIADLVRTVTPGSAIAAKASSASASAPNALR
jgi:fermentation-respiration switch protein FrsA (DUF1100 family)